MQIGIFFNIYICKCFSLGLYDINNKIDIQFCINTFDHMISFFQFVWMQYPRFNIGLAGSLYYFHIVYKCKLHYRLYGRKTHKKELVLLAREFHTLWYMYHQSFFNFPLIRGLSPELICNVTVTLDHKTQQIKNSGIDRIRIQRYPK